MNTDVNTFMNRSSVNSVSDNSSQSLSSASSISSSQIKGRKLKHISKTLKMTKSQKLKDKFEKLYNKINNHKAQKFAKKILDLVCFITFHVCINKS